MARVLVTGGSGKLGRAVLRDLVAHGYDVLNVDQQRREDPICMLGYEPQYSWRNETSGGN